MWLIKASLKNPHFVATIVFMLLVLGLFSAVHIPVDILPVFKAPAVQVLTYFQGMPASSVEKTLSARIERWAGQAEGAMSVESKSVPGVSIVRLYFRDDVDSSKALTLTTSLAQGAQATLPPNTLPPVVLPFDPTGTMPLGILTVSNPSLDEAHVKDLARIDVRNMLGKVPGCVAPVVVGGKDRTILVYLDPRKMEARKVSPLDVVEALKTGNMMVTPGTAYFGKNQVLLDSNVMVARVKELNDLPIRTTPNDAVYLRDIGKAEDSNAIQTSRVRIDGHREVYVPIYRQQGASSLAVAHGVRDYLAEMESRLPAGTKLNFVMDQSSYVEESIHALIHEGLIGAALVSLMILIFLGNWRMTVIASLSIPLAILGAIIGLYTTGNTINAMTLGGLALAIGPLVDDAIVELENNHRNYHLGKSRIRAALDGCAEVMVPVLIATFTTNIVLAPVALMPGMGGFLFRPLALAVTFAMFTSFLLSRTFVPMMCAKFLPDEHARRCRNATPHALGAARDPEPHGAAEIPYHDGGRPGFFSRLQQRIERGLEFLTLGYSRLLHLALQRRVLVLSVVGVLFVGSLFLTLGIGREFFPQVDAGQITMYVRAPSNLRLDATEQRVADVEKVIREVIPEDEREMILSEIGLDPDWSAAYTANSGQQDAVVRIQLNEDRRFSAQEYAEQLRHVLADDVRFYDMRFSFDTGGMVSTALNLGASSPIDVQISGGTPATAESFAREVCNRLRKVPGAADVRVLQRRDAPYLMIDVDRQKAAAAGLSAEEVIQQAVAAMNSSVAINRNFWIDTKSGNQYFVAVQYPEKPGSRLEDILNVYATGTHQPNTVKLSSLVTLLRRSSDVEVNHTSLYRTFNVLVNVEGTDLASVALTIQQRLGTLQAPEGVRWELRGEYARMNESTRNLLFGMGMAVMLVYLLQVALFRSWVGPFVIMFTVPLGLIGVLVTLYLTNTTLNVQSQMGVIFLVGIAVNNGVLLADFANKRRREGFPVENAIMAAAAIRFRPILMTFLATFLDLLPMAIGIGRGSEATIPLARAVVGGLLSSTLLTLFVVPIMYKTMLRDPLPPEVDIEAELNAPLAYEPMVRAEEVPLARTAIVGKDHEVPHEACGELS
jgi:multidrug efflux pump subunit AcrB